ncbi:MAG TPA: hypothetical protein VFO02_11970 [Burkholderiales bacterium]|nr:hypothetical protein [Burkholderiales bacterium]
MTTRRLFIALAAVVLAAGVVAGRERPALELLPERAAQAPAAATEGIDLERLRRGESSTPQADPFAKKDFEKRAAKSASTIPAKPVAPALPFQYFGRLTENGKTEIFVMRGDELLSIAPGQTLGEYRVESIGDKGIAFTYLPLKTTQRLDFQ